MLKNRNKRDWNVPPYPKLGMPLNPLGVIISDPMGGYTGTPVDFQDEPVPDADDL